MSPSQLVTVKNPSPRRPIPQFLDTLEVKPKTAVRRFCAAKTERKAIRADSMLWYSIPKRLVY